MQIHILGIAGTFMGGVALLASQLKMKVTGSDLNIYPPMSTQLESQGITLITGYDSQQLDLNPEMVVVGNAMKRGLPVVEALLESDLPWMSGPAWLSEYVLKKQHVLAVAGTHGKTTTASMLAWILESAGYAPGFLIGGIPNNFGVSARLGAGKYFVIEADEYDTAFFDKRSKFIHYHPRTLIINNLEFDHADIFPDLAAIQQQFHHLIRTLPQSACIIYPETDKNVKEVLEKGCWSRAEGVHAAEGWNIQNVSSIGNVFDIVCQNSFVGRLEWTLLGEHNRANALSAIVAALQVGIEPEVAIKALSQFKGVKRRLEIKGQIGGITLYDDFAHHPTAIETTLAGLRAKIGKSSELVAVVDIRSNTMRAGHHRDQLPAAVQAADKVFFFKPSDITWDVDAMWQKVGKAGGVYSDKDELIAVLAHELDRKLESNPEQSDSESHVIFMSNGGFGVIQDEFSAVLKDKVSVKA